MIQDEARQLLLRAHAEPDAVSDSWGPSDDPECFLRAAFAPLAAGRAPP